MMLIEGQIYTIEARVLNESGNGPDSNVLEIEFDNSVNNPDNLVLSI
jgi:hypothetical protein